MLWERKKYWQAQRFTLTHGLNSPDGWYAQNRRVYKKIKYFIIEYIRDWNSYYVETSSHISLCSLYGRFLYDVDFFCGNS